MERDDLVYDGEAYAYSPFARGAPRFFYLVEFFPYERDLFFRDAVPVILECKVYLAVPLRIFYGEGFSGTSIFYEIREDIMKELDEFTLVEMQDQILFAIGEDDFLSFFCEKGHIFFPYMPDDLRCIYRKDLQHRSVGLFQFFVFHDGTGDFDEPVDLFMEKRVVFRGAFYDSVIHPFQIALDGGDGGFYLMAQIGKEIGSDFLLKGEILVERVDRVDERSEFILFPVIDLFVSFPGDDIGEILHDGLDGTEGYFHPDP